MWFLHRIFAGEMIVGRDLILQLVLFNGSRITRGLRRPRSVLTNLILKVIRHRSLTWKDILSSANTPTRSHQLPTTRCWRFLNLGAVIRELCDRSKIRQLVAGAFVLRMT